MSLYSVEPSFRYVVNDLIIKEENCNLHCEYCLTGQSWFKQEHSAQKIFEPPKSMSVEFGTSAYERLELITDISSRRQIPVIKVSGGEIMLIKGIVDFIERLSKKFEKVVLLTNGLLLNDNTLSRFQKAGNIVLQISLDAAKYEGNKYRIQSRNIHNLLMNKINNALSAEIPTEIYCVVNNLSIEYLQDTIEYFEPYSNIVRFFPFPVRGPKKEKFLPASQQYGKIEELLWLKIKHKKLLPHESYLNNLADFFFNNGRRFTCHLPRIAFSSFDDGTITNCPNIWFNQVGNLLKENESNLFHKLNTSKFRELLLSKQPRLDACKGCFTPWDPVSLYFEDKMPLTDLIDIPIYSGEKTVDLLKWNKQLYRNSEAVSYA